MRKALRVLVLEITSQTALFGLLGRTVKKVRLVMRRFLMSKLILESNSVHIYAATAAGGPMDVVLLAGLDEGVYDASMWMYIPDGSSAYYNVQEDQSPGVAGPLKLRLPLLVICKLSWMVQLLQPALSRSTRGSKLVT